MQYRYPYLVVVVLLPVAASKVMTSRASVSRHLQKTKTTAIMMTNATASEQTW